MIQGNGQVHATRIMTEGYMQRGYDRQNDIQDKWPNDRPSQNENAVKDSS